MSINPVFDISIKQMFGAVSGDSHTAALWRSQAKHQPDPRQTGSHQSVFMSAAQALHISASDIVLH